MCGDLLKSLFGGGPDTSAADAATAKAKAEADTALEAQLKAKNDATSAADAGNESTRSASEAAMRRLAAGAMFGVGGTTAPFNSSSVATRELFGS